MLEKHTVNLLARLSMVRIHLPPPFNNSRCSNKLQRFLLLWELAEKILVFLVFRHEINYNATF